MQTALLAALCAVFFLVMVVMVRGLAPLLVGSVVLVALWPFLCVSEEDGPTTCQSAALVPLPWMQGGDAWGYVVAVAAAAATYVAVRQLLRRSPSTREVVQHDPVERDRHSSAG